MSFPRRNRIKPLATAVAGLAIAAVAAGCDASENADLENGRDLFSSQCGTCHALAEAGSTADIGPDLDAAFAAARDAGMDQDTFEGVVESQIENPRKVAEDDPTYMAANIVEGDDARDVAAYVASVAGVPGVQPPVAPGGEGGQVFANNGCGTCHQMTASGSAGGTGPSLDEVIPGQDTAMIEQSIVDPNSVLSQGFSAGIMPLDYGESIPAPDLDLLVEYLETCAGTVEEVDGQLEGPAFCFNEEDLP